MWGKGLKETQRIQLVFVEQALFKRFSYLKLVDFDWELLFSKLSFICITKPLLQVNYFSFSADYVIYLIFNLGFLEFIFFLSQAHCSPIRDLCICSPNYAIEFTISWVPCSIFIISQYFSKLDQIFSHINPPIIIFTYWVVNYSIYFCSIKIIENKFYVRTLRFIYFSSWYFAQGELSASATIEDLINYSKLLVALFGWVF